MILSLFSISKSYLKNNLIDKASHFLGERKKDINEAINSILVVFYGKIIDLSNDKDKLDKTYRVIISSDFNNLKYVNLEDIFSGENSLLLNDSNVSLTTLFEEDWMEDVSFSIAETYNIHKESVSALFKMVLPVVIGAINKVYFNEKLDQQGFYALLNYQINYPKEDETPFSLLNKLTTVHGIESLKAISSTKKEERVQKIIPIVKFVLLGVVVVGLLVAGVMYYKSVNLSKKEKDNEELLSNNIIDNLDYFYTPTKLQLGKYVEGYEFLGTLTERELKNGDKILLFSKGGVSNFLNHIEDKNFDVNKENWFDIYGVLVNKVSTNINLEKSKFTLDQLAHIMKVYPNISVKVAAYTDNKGSSKYNFNVSYGIAKKVVEEFIKRGINPERLGFEGYGEEYPVHSNENEWGRKLNQRIAIKLMKK